MVTGETDDDIADDCFTDFDAEENRIDADNDSVWFEPSF